MASESQAKDTIPQILKSIYGYEGDGPEPYAMGQMSLMISKLISSAEQGAKESGNPADVKRSIFDAIGKEMMRLAKLHDAAAAVEALRRQHNLTAARIPSQEDSDRLIRYEAHLSREFDRTLTQLDRLQRQRLGQPVLPKLEVHHSLS
jgi:hypothetical protein